MKRIFLSLIINSLICVAALASPREVINFNFDWQYAVSADDFNGTKGIEGITNWQYVDLPHDFQINQPWDKSAGGNRGFKQMAQAWYCKTFNAEKSWQGKRVLLDFEGIMLYGDVYLNGVKAGSADYGYLGFEADITKLLKYDTENVLAVYCSTGKTGASRWYTGGGLYRDVHLIVKDSIAIARNGVYITTPQEPLLSSALQKAEIQISVEIEGLRGKKRHEVEIVANIFSPKGEFAGTTRAAPPVKSKKRTEETPLPSVNISAPLLWDIDSPNLYTAEITVLNNGNIIDRVVEQFGIRTIEFHKDYGFKLNGKKVFLKGVANHHDLGAVGAAAHERAIERYLKQLKLFGFNHIRTSHNPYSKSFLNLADRYGILITDELYDKWSNTAYWSGKRAWSELVFENVPEWIKRDRNHPSVIMWSFGNELQMREDLAGFPTGDWGVTTYRMLNVLAKRYDSTRPTTVAMFPARAAAMTKEDPDFNVKILPPELATVTEVASFNYRWMNYDDYLKHAPDMNIYQSEATTNELLAPFYGMQPRMTGLAYWGAVEYWGESNGYPKKGWAYSFFNHALEPFPQAYLIKSAFSNEPLVHIGVLDKASESEDWNEQNVGTQQVSSHWNREKGKRYNIFTYTNADEVELLLNGKSLGKQQNNRSDINKRNVISWNNVPYEAGKIVAIARNGEMEAARHTLETTGKAIALKMELETPNDFQSDGMDLQYVKVYAVDSKGRVVPTSEGEVTFEVSGAAKLIAVDNGDHYSDELFSGNKRLLHNGFALAILRSTQTAGEVKIKASVNGLKSVKKTISTFNN